MRTERFRSNFQIQARGLSDVQLPAAAVSTVSSIKIMSLIDIPPTFANIIALLLSGLSLVLIGSQTWLSLDKKV